jgi:hypothetical protein
MSQATAEGLARRILQGLDEAMAGQPRPLRVRSAPASGSAPLLATVDYIIGYPCLWITCFDFYSERTAAFLQAVHRCRQSGKVDEIEVCLRHALEPGRSLWFDGLMDDGFAPSQDGQSLVWSSPRVT